MTTKAYNTVMKQNVDGMDKEIKKIVSGESPNRILYTYIGRLLAMIAGFTNNTTQFKIYDLQHRLTVASNSSFGIELKSLMQDKKDIHEIKELAQFLQDIQIDIHSLIDEVGLRPNLSDTL